MNRTEKCYLYIEKREVLHDVKTALKSCAILKSSKWKKQGRQVRRWANCYWIHKHCKVLIKCVSPCIKFMAYSTTSCESFHTKCFSLWRESSKILFPMCRILFEVFITDSVPVRENKITLSILSHVSILIHPKRKPIIFKMFPALMYPVLLNKKIHMY